MAAEVELVSRRRAELHAAASLEAVIGASSVRSASSNLFAPQFFDWRLPVLIQRTRMIAGILVDVARHYALWSVGQHLGLSRGAGCGA